MKLDVIVEDLNDDILGDNMNIPKSQSSKSMSMRKKDSQLDEIGEQVKGHLRNRYASFATRKQS